MTNTQKAIDLIKQSGMRRITPVPHELYEKTLDEFPLGARVAVNVDQENLIVYQGIYAITPSKG